MYFEDTWCTSKAASKDVVSILALSSPGTSPTYLSRYLGKYTVYTMYVGISLCYMCMSQ